ncbi:MAG: hypothetical protein EB145_16605 [Proteobacteria bacterium]|nr:hypothetical protein [Pseudomonadota bacterium]
MGNPIANGNPQNINRRADMATQSSREAALERRKALSDGGKKAASRYSTDMQRENNQGNLGVARGRLANETATSQLDNQGKQKKDHLKRLRAPPYFSPYRC